MHRNEIKMLKSGRVSKQYKSIYIIYINIRGSFKAAFIGEKLTKGNLRWYNIFDA